MNENKISDHVLNIGRTVQSQLQTVIHGQATAIQSLLVAITAGGHVLRPGFRGMAFHHQQSGRRHEHSNHQPAPPARPNNIW